jgi:Jacalin-like lectin domain
MSVMELEKHARARQPVTESLVVSALGQGYDSVLGRALSTAVSGTVANTSAIGKLSFKRITDLETLATSLDVSQSLSVTYGSIASGSEKTDFVSNLNLTTYSVSIIVHARHVSGIHALTDYALKTGISAPTNHEQRVQFFHGYGDSFISSLTLGGEYIAIYSFYSRSEQEQNQLVADLQLAGLYDGVQVNADLQAKISNFNSSTQTRTAFSQIVTGIKDPSLPSSDKICEYAEKFSSLPLTAPSILKFETTGYERVHPVIIGGFGDIPKSRAYFVGTGVIDGLTKSLVAVRQLQDQIGWLSSIYQFYGYGDDTTLSAASRDAKEDLVAIDGQMQAWETDPEPAGGFPPLKLKTAKLGTPSLNCTFQQTDAYGGDGGGPFNDVDITTYLQLQTRIVNVRVQTGSWVDAVITIYQDSSGRQWTVKNGGNGGRLSAELKFMANESIASVYGRAGSGAGGVVDNFNIVSTGGGSIGGGDYRGPEFEWSVPKDSVVLGFAGRSGAYLDQVRICYATFNPAKWSGPSA